jgi:uncharacterized membrane protein
LRSCKKSAYGAEEIAPPGAAAPRTGLRGALPMALAFLAAIALLSPSRALAAIGLPQIGTTVSDAIMLGDRQVPLPTGEWHVVATGFGTVAGRSPGPYGAILGVTLARLRGDEVEAIVVAQTNALPVDDGWGPSGACERKDLAFVSSVRVQSYDLSCEYVGVAEAAALAGGAAALPSPLGEPAREIMTARGWRLPKTFLVAGFRTGNRRDVLDIRYGFDPAATPLAVPRAAEASAWTAAAVEGDAMRSRVLAALVGWSGTTRKLLDQRLAHPAERPESLAWPWQALTAGGGDGGPAEGRAISVWELAFYKDLTYRSISMSLNASIAYLVSGSALGSGLMPIVQGTTHFALFYLHELGWELPRHQPVQDFVAAPAGLRAGADVRLAAAHPAAASTDLAPQRKASRLQAGDGVVGYAALGGKQAPLPPGNWEIAGVARDGEGRDAVDGMVLVKRAGGRLAGIVVARTNALPQKATYGTTAECDRDDIYLAVHRYDTRVDGLCIFVKHVLAVPTASDMSDWAAARRWLAARQIAFSGTWLMAGFRVRDRAQMLDIRYYFPPPDDAGDPLPINWASSAWAPRRVAKDAARRGRIDALVAWTSPMTEPIERGFRNQLGPGFEPVSPWAGPRGDAAPAGLRLDELGALRTRGAIGNVQYIEQLAMLERRAAQPPPVEFSQRQRIGVKTATYSVPASVDSAVVAYFVLGSAILSLGYTVGMNIAAPAAFYLHELAWSSAGIGKPPVQAARELAEIGIDR